MIERGSVVGLQLLARHGEAPRRVSQVRALVGRGLEGDLHGKTRATGSRRQVLILDSGVPRAFGLQPGDLREQITVDFPGLDGLPAGSRLRIGPVTFELAGGCDPCTHIGGLVGAADPGAFERQLEGRRGQLARVVAADGDGMLRLGDPVIHTGVQDPAGASPR